MMEFRDIRSASTLPRGESGVLFTMGSAYVVYRDQEGRLWQGARMWEADYIREDLRAPKDLNFDAPKSETGYEDRM